MQAPDRPGQSAPGNFARPGLVQARRSEPAGRPGRALSAVSLRDEMNTTSPLDCPAWKKLEAHANTWRAARLAELLAGHPERARQMVVTAPGVQLDYSRQRVGALTLRLLAQLAAERGFDEWRAALFSGAKINTTEDRAVTHTALRAKAIAPEVLKLAEAIRTEK